MADNQVNNASAIGAAFGGVAFIAFCYWYWRRWQAKKMVKKQMGDLEDGRGSKAELHASTTNTSPIPSTRAWELVATEQTLEMDAQPPGPAELAADSTPRELKTTSPRSELDSAEGAWKTKSPVSSPSRTWRSADEVSPMTWDHASGIRLPTYSTASSTIVTPATAYSPSSIYPPSGLHTPVKGQEKSGTHEAESIPGDRRLQLLARQQELQREAETLRVLRSIEAEERKIREELEAMMHASDEKRSLGSSHSTCSK